MSEIRMFDLGYPKADLGHGSVWATTIKIRNRSIHYFIKFQQYREIGGRFGKLCTLLNKVENMLRLDSIVGANYL